MTNKDLYGWAVTEKYALSYTEVCEQAVKKDETFQVFKRIPAYNAILEHVSYDLGRKYLDNVRDNNPSLLGSLDMFIRRNDFLGSPKKARYPEYSSLNMSPTTARYIKVLSDLELIFGSLDGFNIVEIGGGYGGLATVINTKYELNCYYDVDLPQACKLFKKYCIANDITNIKTIPPSEVRDTFVNLGIDLVISNYALSECDISTQESYCEDILDSSKRGYITYNSSKEKAMHMMRRFKNYNNFLVHETDLCHKGHPIMVWGSK